VLLLLLLLLLQVQSGAGRSGMWWAHVQFDGGAMQPDMVVFAKGIASGYPMAGACCCLRHA
jgi:4-aminobutyrate aminotransferase-like enzyme